MTEVCPAPLPPQSSRLSCPETNSVPLPLQPTQAASQDSQPHTSYSVPPAPLPIRNRDFYTNYNGHLLPHLAALHALSQRDGPRPVIWLAGDSSLDNKAWILPAAWAAVCPDVEGPGSADLDEEVQEEVDDDDVTVRSEASNSQAPQAKTYGPLEDDMWKGVLTPPVYVPDVAYCINRALLQSQSRSSLPQPLPFALNTSVEATLLRQRVPSLLEQDKFIARHISDRDYLIVSIAGNDIALNPSPKTVFYMGLLLMSPLKMIETGMAPGINYFAKMFGQKVKDYVLQLLGGDGSDASPKGSSESLGISESDLHESTEPSPPTAAGPLQTLARKFSISSIPKSPPTLKVCPRKVLICMPYFPSADNKGPSWASNLLSTINYNSNPEKFQTAMRAVFRLGTQRITIPGVQVEAVPLFDILDWRDVRDYVERVEPSERGSKKMAKAFIERLFPSSE
ncbi:hypothetical protein DFS34DRAFT_651116 [Phlyctochytrium arcticum]|nr:hypothetical protein DFS34DRAFT_651116 [Phlyctochytrium arcticum]